MGKAFMGKVSPVYVILIPINTCNCVFTIFYPQMPINAHKYLLPKGQPPASDAYIFLRPSETLPRWDVFLQQQHGLFTTRFFVHNMGTNRPDYTHFLHCCVSIVSVEWWHFRKHLRVFSCLPVGILVKPYVPHDGVPLWWSEFTSAGRELLGRLKLGTPGYH